MINEVILVGKIKEIEEGAENQNLVLEVERPFNDNDGRTWDVFTCKLWSAIFKKVLLSCKLGDLLAVKGRLITNEDKVFIMAENVVILNKSRDNILKESQFC